MYRTFPFLGIISVNGGNLSIEYTVEYRSAFLSQRVYSIYILCQYFKGKTFLETEIYLKSIPSFVAGSLLNNLPSLQNPITLKPKFDNQLYFIIWSGPSSTFNISLSSSVFPPLELVGLYLIVAMAVYLLSTTPLSGVTENSLFSFVNYLAYSNKFKNTNSIWQEHYRY